MERFAWFYDEIVAQIANLKQFIISVLRKIPYLGDLNEGQLEWILVGLVFLILISIILPLIKWSMRIAVGAAALAAILAFFTSSSFWALLPFTGLGVAIVLFSNRFRWVDSMKSEKKKYRLAADIIQWKMKR
jgi:hypothetical protein